jgi:hypothetical protein
MIEIQAPDGTIVRFPAGTDDATIQRVMRAEYGQQVPTQRTRTALQGLTLGLADEAEAGVRRAFGQPYDETLADIRGGIEAYREDRPVEAMGFELGGAVVPALIPGGGPATAARMAGRGALEGGAYAFNTGEGGLAERAARVPGGAALGGAGSVVAGQATRAAGGALTTLTDATRRLVGGRGSTVVENEIQRLVQQTGRTPDQIADDILNGRLLAENSTIKAAVRSLRSGGGEASRIIQESLEPRPTMTRAAALDDLNKYLADISAPSALQAQRRSEDVAKVAERAAYSQFRDMPAPDEVVNELADALRRVPSAADEVGIALRAQTGAAPFFEILEDGSVQFTRSPTVAEVENVRRAIGNRASALYRGSMGAAGEAVAGVETGLRGLLDETVPELSATRATAAGVRQQRDAFDAGRTALAGDVNEKLGEFAKLTDPSQIEAYRAGLMSAIQARSATGSRQSMIRNMANEETKEGRILREVLPQDAVDDVLRSIQTASGAQDAANYVLGGSATAETLMEQGRQGLGLSVADITGALSMDGRSMMNVATKITDRFRRDLTDAERARIARILVSEDADLVRRAIEDDGALAALRDRIEQISATATRGAARAGAIAPAETGGDISGQSIRGLLSQ